METNPGCSRSRRSRISQQSFEQLQGESTVCDGIAPLRADELVVLDQMMVRPFGSREWRKIERVHDRQVEERGPGQVGFDETSIVGDDVVPDHAIRPIREHAQTSESLLGRFCIEDPKLGVSVQGAHVPDSSFCSYLQIERQAPLHELGERRC